jgi:hypothetical protein
MKEYRRYKKIRGLFGLTVLHLQPGLDYFIKIPLNICLSHTPSIVDNVLPVTFWARPICHLILLHVARRRSLAVNRTGCRKRMTFQYRPGFQILWPRFFLVSLDPSGECHGGVVN